MSLLGFFAREYRDYVYCPTGEGGGIDPTCSPTGESRGKVPADQKTIWHATPISRLDSIIKEGIVTGKFKNWELWEHSGFEKHVFVATHPKTAMRYGEEAAHLAGEHQFAVIRAQIPKSALIEPDKRAGWESWTVAAVKAEWLKEAVIYDMTQDFWDQKPVKTIKIHATSDFVTYYIPMSVMAAQSLK